MKLFFSIMLSLVLVATAAAGTPRISIESLGRLTVKFAQPQIVPSAPLQTVTGEVSYLPGNGYQLILPFRVLQQQYLVAPQSFITANTPLVKLTGSEVHHFYEMLSAQKAIFAQAESRYKQNLPLFKKQAINQQSWQAIADHYYASKLELGHLQHAEELLQTNGSEDSAYLISPVNGFFKPKGEQLDGEAFLYGEVIEPDALRIKVQVPSSVAAQITGLVSDACQLPVAYRERLGNGLVSRLWSSPLPQQSDCTLSFAEALSVTPVSDQTALSLPASSVYFLDGQYYVLVKQGAELNPLAVSVIGRYDGQLLVADKQILRNAEVLTTSVSAVQGILLGLGGE
ncbi:hypothetical protein [Alteromonas lipolytica]|uniref:RND efflux pump membrane fusion protein barrel-sandwich domain-containing protein n=1 Tax=Alteromonas lipolytica TaxID=1856405 RepID=A0A1E8FB59_9ALTE|nr:hypothetical protein [Alteromonas lipolytica]OFI33145.1 hypothetical protein BFC17_02475 [Alteromonas lipolytica]GGF62092.1 hypothetical protein GCM10011338_13110 [Alteromonas lipolytica]